jgi:hypothetical protein
MPRELIHITCGIVWMRTTIRPVGDWLQTELYLQVDGRSFSVALDTLPGPAFLKCITSARSLWIMDTGAGATQPSERFQVWIIGGEPPVETTASGSYVRYGPMD